MADWKDITNTALEPFKPIRSIDGLAFRDNPIAIAEGAPNAPRIDGAQSPALRNGGVPNGELGAEKFQTGTTERDWVLARTAAASAGAVGTYGFFQYDAINGASGTASPGSTRAGSELEWASSAYASGTNPSGTWMCLGYIPEPLTAGDTNTSQTVWLRIS